ncbi:MAG: hypothetical protein JWN44_2219 [Myxococcales bacterium]|nr:hypothetical protein [Myxococcales bacterium]
MAKPFETWTVLPHRPVQKLEENLWFVEGKLGNIRRVMVVARLKDGRLVIWNAIALDEAHMKELEAWGTPAFLVVPNAMHRMDCKIWKQRYPELKVIAPAAARAKVHQLIPVDGTDGDFGDDSVRVFAPEPTRGRDAAMEVRSQGGTTLVVNDLVFNQRNQPGLAGLAFRLAGFTGDKPRVPPAARLFFVKDKPGLKLWFEAEAQKAHKRLIVSHGDIVDAPAQALRDAAASF